MPSPADLAALAVNTSFAAFGVAANYTPPGGGAAAPCTVIKDSRDRRMQFGLGQPVVQGDVIEIRFSEVAAPAKDGTVAITGGATLEILDDPQTEDPERLVWICTVK